MTRRILTAAGLLSGVLIGAVLTAGRIGPVATTTAGSNPPRLPTAAALDAVAATTGLLLAWTSPPLSANVADAIARDPRLATATAVRGGTVDLLSTRDASRNPVDRAPEGMSFPLDAIAVEPGPYSELALEAAAVGALADGQALLSTTGAELRRLGTGGSLDVRGVELEVTGIVSDVALGGAELAVTTATGYRLGLRVPRYLLVAHATARGDAEDDIRALVPSTTAIRFRAPGETPFLRDGDAVAPLAMMKAQFGEFAYRLDTGRDIVQDAAWTRANIVEAEVPLLGTVRCHRAIVEPLRAALAELEQRNLAGLVDRDAYAGCWNPRRISADDADLSRHAWGVALDVNWTKNPTGLASVQDQRLVATMAKHGFTWGGRWLVPDPAHFEVVVRLDL